MGRRGLTGCETHTVTTNGRRRNRHDLNDGSASCPTFAHIPLGRSDAPTSEMVARQGDDVVRARSRRLARAHEQLSWVRRHPTRLAGQRAALPRSGRVQAARRCVLRRSSARLGRRGFGSPGATSHIAGAHSVLNRRINEYVDTPRAILADPPRVAVVLFAEYAVANAADRIRRYRL